MSLRVFLEQHSYIWMLDKQLLAHLHIGRSACESALLRVLIDANQIANKLLFVGQRLSLLQSWSGGFGFLQLLLLGGLLACARIVLQHLDHGHGIQMQLGSPVSGQRGVIRGRDAFSR